MRLEQLQYLIAISQHQSISKASEALYISHQSMSAAIKALEAELGTSLIVRSFSGVTLTADGQYLVNIAQDFCRKLQRFHPDAANGPQALRGSLHIAGSRLALDGLLPKLIANFCVQYPQVEVTTCSVKPAEAAEYFAAGEADLAFLAVSSAQQPDADPTPNLTFQPCMKLTPAIEVAKTSPLAKSKSITLQRLRRQRILYNCSQQVADDAFNQWPFAIIQGNKVRYEPSRFIYAELIRSGYGIGISALYRTEPLNAIADDFVYIPISNGEEQWIGYLCQAQRPFSKIAQQFLTHLQSYYTL